MEIKGILGDGGYFEAEADREPFETPWRYGEEFQGKARLVCFPDSTEKVSQIMQLCSEHKVPVVPQGGNTGVVGGSTPDASGEEIVLNLSRMNRIRKVDTENFTAVVEAGCVLQTFKETLEAQQLLFPLSMASQGSAEMGGVVSTNAGGVAVLKYGTMRELVLGLEVVLADGRVLSMLSELRKDNTGYHLPALFVGAEGTLGIVTAVSVKLFPLPVQKETAFVAVSGVEEAVTLFTHMMRASNGALSAFELLSDLSVQLVTKHISGHRSPIRSDAPYMVLMEVSSANADEPIRERLEAALTHSPVTLTDGVVAESEAQRELIWGVREHIAEAQKKEGAMVNFDITIPISGIAGFIEQTVTECMKLVPGIRALPFGHVGDGNVHFNLLQPLGEDPERFLKEKPKLKKLAYGLVEQYQGSISAEHGIGRERRKELKQVLSAEEYGVMVGVKKLLDPGGILNRGKVLL